MPVCQSTRCRSSRSRGRRGRTLGALVGTLGVTLSLGVPGEWVPRFSPSMEFAVHALAFAGACGLWALRRHARLSVVFALGVAAAVGTEILQQAVVPLRSGSTSDALADVLGVAVGVGSVYIIRHRVPTVE